RRTIVPALFRRRDLPYLEPAIFEPEFERRLTASWIGGGAEAGAPAIALALRERLERYAARVPRDRAAILCTAALRPMLADFLLRSGLRVGVYAYGELPSELELRPADVVDQAALAL
ncbi:MAG TPA: hypothetical protein VIJ77_11640, partial [Candidatus Tumulicola sp.]